VKELREKKARKEKKLREKETKRRQRKQNERDMHRSVSVLHFFPDFKKNATYFMFPVWLLGSRVVSVLDSGAEGPDSNRSRDAVG